LCPASAPRLPAATGNCVNALLLNRRCFANQNQSVMELAPVTFALGDKVGKVLLDEAARIAGDRANCNCNEDHDWKAQNLEHRMLSLEPGYKLNQESAIKVKITAPKAGVATAGQAGACRLLTLDPASESACGWP
jgi:hypothetical protein